MIVVQVKLHPAARPDAPIQLGHLVISNDETGTSAIGNYDVEVRFDDTGEVRKGRVEGYKRNRSIWSLVTLALKSVLRDDEIAR